MSTKKLDLILKDFDLFEKKGWKHSLEESKKEGLVNVEIYQKQLTPNTNFRFILERLCFEESYIDSLPETDKEKISNVTFGWGVDSEIENISKNEIESDGGHMFEGANSYIHALREIRIGITKIERELIKNPDYLRSKYLELFNS